MTQIIFLVLLCTLFPAVFYPLVAASKDNIQIELNGKYNSLKDGWHKSNALIRVVVFMSLAGFYVLLGEIAGGVVWGLVTAVAYGLLTLALFWVLFDRRLNRLRGKELNYVSQEPDAAYSDRFIVEVDRRTALNLNGAAWVVKLATLLITLVAFGGALHLLYSACS